MLTGTTTIRIYTGQEITYDFAKDGHLLRHVWVQEAEGTRYYWANHPETGWQTIDGKQYYFDPVTALMQTGDVEIDGVVYAFDYSGVFKHEGAHAFEFRSHTDMSCTEDEVNVYDCTICGAEKREVVKATPGHVDADQDDLCDVCGKYYKARISFLEWIMRFFIRIRNWFRNLFKG